MSQILFNDEFVVFLKSTKHYPIANALILFQQYVENPKNHTSNDMCYWIIPKVIRMARNCSEILNIIRINLENQADYTQSFNSNIKLFNSKQFGFYKHLDIKLNYYSNSNDPIYSPMICESDDPECDGIAIRL
jgi:hypothetical protein